MSVLRKRDRVKLAEGGAGRIDGADFGVLYPSVWEHLSSGTYPDGAKRLLSTLTIFVDQEAVKACLNDREQGLTGWASGASVDAVLQSLETALANDTLEWRVAGGGKKKR